MAYRKIALFSKESRGGIGTFLSQIIELNNKHKDLQLNIVLYKKDNLGPKFPFAIYLNEYYPSDSRFSLIKLVLFFLNLARTWNYLYTEKPDVILGCDQYAACELLLYKFCCKCFCIQKKVLILINTNIQEVIKEKKPFPYSYVLKKTFGLLFGLADKIIYVSKDLQKYTNSYLSYKRTKSVAIFNHGVDLSEISIKKNEDITSNFFYKSNSVRLLSVSRIERQKDILTLLKAYKYAKLRFSEIVLCIVGEYKEDSYKKEIESCLRNLHLGNNEVNFVGWKENVWPFYANSDIFVSSSIYEGFGGTIIEALASGLPIISTDAPYGPREILSNGRYGVLVNTENYVELGNKILDFAKSTQLRRKYSALAHKRSRNYFKNKFLNKYYALFKSVLIIPRNNQKCIW